MQGKKDIELCISYIELMYFMAFIVRECRVIFIHPKASRNLSVNTPETQFSHFTYSLNTSLEYQWHAFLSFSEKMKNTDYRYQSYLKMLHGVKRPVNRKEWKSTRMETKQGCTEKEIWRTSKNQVFKFTVLPLRTQLSNKRELTRSRTDKFGKMLKLGAHILYIIIEKNTIPR